MSPFYHSLSLLQFMVEGICKSFLQLFLVGMDGLTMNFAIQKLVPMEANQTLNEYNKVNATKVSSCLLIVVGCV